MRGSFTAAVAADSGAVLLSALKYHTVSELVAQMVDAARILCGETSSACGREAHLRMMQACGEAIRARAASCGDPLDASAPVESRIAALAGPDRVNPAKVLAAVRAVASEAAMPPPETVAAEAPPPVLREADTVSAPASPSPL